MAHTMTQIGCVAAARKQPRTLLQRFFGFAELRRQRLDLSRLSEDQLLDVGLHRGCADKEARRPFWDAPENWRD